MTKKKFSSNCPECYKKVRAYKLYKEGHFILTPISFISLWLSFQVPISALKVRISVILREDVFIYKFGYKSPPPPPHLKNLKKSLNKSCSACLWEHFRCVLCQYGSDLGLYWTKNGVKIIRVAKFIYLKFCYVPIWNF